MEAIARHGLLHFAFEDTSKVRKATNPTSPTFQPDLALLARNTAGPEWGARSLMCLGTKGDDSQELGPTSTLVPNPSPNPNPNSGVEWRGVGADGPGDGGDEEAGPAELLTH